MAVADLTGAMGPSPIFAQNLPSNISKTQDFGAQQGYADK
jgi:hypothetical protein